MGPKIVLLRVHLTFLSSWWIERFCVFVVFFKDVRVYQHITQTNKKKFFFCPSNFCNFFREKERHTHRQFTASTSNHLDSSLSYLQSFIFGGGEFRVNHDFSHLVKSAELSEIMYWFVGFSKVVCDFKEIRVMG